MNLMISTLDRLSRKIKKKQLFIYLFMLTGCVDTVLNQQVPESESESQSHIPIKMPNTIQDMENVLDLELIEDMILQDMFLQDMFLQDMLPQDMLPQDMEIQPDPDCSRCLGHYVNCRAVCMNRFDNNSQGNGYASGYCISLGDSDLQGCCACERPMPFKACSRCLNGLSSCAEACGQANSYCQNPYSEDPSDCCACVP